MPLLGGFAIPLGGLDEILFHAPAVFVTNAQVVLRPGVALFGGFAVPLDGLGDVLFYAPAVVVTKSKIALRRGVALRGGFAEPLDGHGVVLFHALAMVIAVTQLVLGLSVAQLGGLFQIFHALGLVGLLLIALKQLLRGFGLFLGGRLLWRLARLARPAVPTRCLYIVLFHAAAEVIAVAQLGLGRAIALFGGFFQIFHAFGLVGLLLIQPEQSVRRQRLQLLQPTLGILVPLLGGFAVPLDGPGGVFFHAPAGFITPSQPIPRLGAVLPGESEEPPGGFRLVLFYVLALGIGPGHDRHGLGAALLGGFAVPLHGLGGIFFHAAALSIAVAQLNPGQGIALFGGLFQAFHAFGLVGLLPVLLVQLLRCLRLQLLQPTPGRGETLFGGLAVPFGGLGGVFFHAPAMVIALAQAILRREMTLFSGPAVQPGGLGGVSRHADAEEIAVTQHILGRGIALIGGFLEPPGGLGGVLFHAPAGQIATAQIILGRGIALFGNLAVPSGGPGVVLIHADAEPEAVAQLKPGWDVALTGGLVEPLGGLDFVFFRAPATGAGDSQPILGRRVAAVCQAAEAALRCGAVIGVEEPFGHQFHQGRALLLPPLAAQGVGGGGGCHREGGGVLFIVAGPVVPASGADRSVVFLVTYRAFPHDSLSFIRFNRFIRAYGFCASTMISTMIACTSTRMGMVMEKRLCWVLWRHRYMPIRTPRLPPANASRNSVASRTRHWRVCARCLSTAMVTKAATLMANR